MAHRAVSACLAAACLLAVSASTASAGKPPRRDTAAPTVVISTPSAGATINGTVSMAGGSSDNAQVSKVEVSIDGGAWGPASGTASWSRVIDTTALANSSHTFSARATDSSGNATVASVTVTVANTTTTTTTTATTPPPPPPPPPADTTAPTVQVTSPGAGATVSGTISVLGSAADDAGVSQVEIQVDGGSYRLASGTTNWSGSVDTTPLSNGSHTITARATDSSGNVATASVPVSVQNNATLPAGVSEQLITPEGAKIQIFSDVTGWTAQRVYDLLRPNAYQLSLLGPGLTIKVQTTYPSSTSSSATQTSGTYSGYKATIYLQAKSGTAFTARPDYVTAHEYGHAWTTYHLFMTHQGDWSTWLSARNLVGDARVDSTYNWSKTEMIADDYRMLFGTSAATSQAGYINAEVSDPRTIAGFTDFFTNVWA